MKTLVVTGTGTEVGKTIVTAAIATAARLSGKSVAVVKPMQTGVGPGEESDLDVIGRLSHVSDLHELARYPEPLAPATAARRAGVAGLSVDDAVAAIAALRDRDLVIVEGAGGVLVRLDAANRTIADLATGLDADVLVVATAGLGTLNATALTCRAVRAAGLHCLGVVIGSWPAEPDLASWTNLTDLPSYAAADLLGMMPAGAGQLSATDFGAVAVASLAAGFDGRWLGPPTTAA